MCGAAVSRGHCCGIVGVVLLRWMPHIFARLWKRCDSNWRPWSVVIVCGHPKRAIQPDRRARDTVSAVMSGMGKAYGQRVKRSTPVRQYSNPAEEVRGPTMSMLTCRKRAGGRVNLPTGVMVWRKSLERWQGWQARAQFRQSFSICWPHEAFGEELSRCLNPCVAEGMQGVEDMTAERRWDVWARFTRRGVAVQLD